MIIYYDNTTTERYREVLKKGGDGTSKDGMQSVDVQWPVEYETKAEVLYDVNTSTLVGVNTVITDKRREKVRDEVLDIVSKVFMFVDSSDVTTALNFLKARIYIIMNSNNLTEILSAVQQIKNQAENILNSLNDYTP